MTDELTVGVIGDLVGSRRAPDRVALQKQLDAALELANRLVKPVEPLTVTLGDEFQGRYPTLDHAMAATLVLHLDLGHERVRFGIGRGPLWFNHGQAPFGQDGPVWWAARAALNEVAAEAGARRTLYAENDGTGPQETSEVQQVNASLAIRDALLPQLDERDRQIVLAMIQGAQQREIGEQLGVSQPAISQRVRRRSLDLIAESFTTLLDRPQPARTTP